MRRSVLFPFVPALVVCAAATSSATSRRFARHPDTLPTCQFQTLWRKDHGFDRAFLAELIAVITRYPDARFGIALPSDQTQSFLDAFVRIRDELLTDAKTREVFGFTDTLFPATEAWRYTHALDVERMFDASAGSSRFTVRRRGIEAPNLEECRDLRAAVVWAEEEAKRQQDAMLRPIEERRTLTVEPPAAPPTAEPPALDDTARKYLSAAMNLAANGEYATAIGHAEDILTQYPDAPEVLTSLLVWQATERRCDGALDRYAKIVASNVAVPSGVHEAAAVCARLIGRPDHAIEAMERAVAVALYADPVYYLALADAFWDLAVERREHGEEPWDAMVKARRYYREYLQRERSRSRTSESQRAVAEQRIRQLAAGVVPSVPRPAPKTPEELSRCYAQYGLRMRAFDFQPNGTVEVRMVDPPDGTPCPPQ